MSSLVERIPTTQNLKPSCLSDGGIDAGFVSLSSALYLSWQELNLDNLDYWQKGQITAPNIDITVCISFLLLL